PPARYFHFRCQTVIDHRCSVHDTAQRRLSCPDRLENCGQGVAIGDVSAIHAHVGAGGFELSNPGFAPWSSGPAAAHQRNRTGASCDEPPRRLEPETLNPAGDEVAPIAA